MRTISVTELGPVPVARTLGELPGLLESLPRLTNEEAAGFAADLQEAREHLGSPDPGTAWAS